MDAKPFGHYELHELLGRGGMGEVYRAYDTNTDRVVALKVLPPHLAADEVFQQRFRQESQAAAGVNDPHVVPIHSYGEIDGRLYLDMRLIEGRTLGAILADDRQSIDPAAAVAIVEQVAEALDAAHRGGLVHRDVKPSNILLTESGFAYLIDFGLARTLGAEGMTTAGNTLGTLGYMAPERFEGGAIDGRVDVYALACVLYELLTGVRPYQADSVERQIAGHMLAPPPKPSETAVRLGAFDEVVAKGMAKQPGKRHQTATELAAAARRALEAPVPRARRTSGRHAASLSRPFPKPLPKPRPKTPLTRFPRRRRVRRRAVLTAGAVVLLAAAGALGAYHLGGGAHPDAAPAGVTESTVPSAAPDGAVPEIAATVPPDVRATGRLVIGVNTPYAPNEFKDSSGRIVGFDVDLMNAVSRVLGLHPDYRETAFESILPSVGGGSFTVGMSSLTDTRERERTVDFVTYFQAGTQWAKRAGTDVDPDAACGLRVGVTFASVQDTAEVPERSAACVAAGLAPIDEVVYTRQDDLTAALVAGDVAAMSADSPVTGFAVKLSAGRLETAGAITRVAPYGWPVAKGSALAESLRRALEHLMATGEYRTIATMWGVDAGMIDRPQLNGARQ